MSAQPELYRKPFKPGYLGSYNWPAMALGCSLFLLTNWAATEYIAMRFEYQPALGDPLFQVGHTPVYTPFAWFLWGLHNITSHDPAVGQPTRTSGRPACWMRARECTSGAGNPGLALDCITCGTTAPSMCSCLPR